MAFTAWETYIAVSGLSGSITPEAQNSEYESGLVTIGEHQWHIRTARNTPRKPGAFVAFWRRDATGNTVPFDFHDPAVGLMVFVEQHGRRGVFRFTAAHLAALNVTSGTRPGKRGFRLYPSWCEALSSPAAVTQQAQAPAFQEY